jgi:hypothetical protein
MKASNGFEIGRTPQKMCILLLWHEGKKNQVPKGDRIAVNTYSNHIIHAMCSSLWVPFRHTIRVCFHQCKRNCRSKRISMELEVETPLIGCLQKHFKGGPSVASPAFAIHFTRGSGYDIFHDFAMEFTSSNPP